MPISALSTHVSAPLPHTLPATTGAGSPTSPTHGLDRLFGDTFTRVARTEAATTTIESQRKQLKSLADYMENDAFDVKSPLRGFSHAYRNTIESHLRQLDRGEFSDPEVTNHFAIDFAKRYQTNLEALKARAQGDTSAQPEAHWVHAWERSVQLSYVPFVPELLEKSGHILLGKTAHIDYDLGLALTEALNHKRARDGSGTARSLEEDFMRAGDHFESTTELTADELGMPSMLASLGNIISDVPTHRRTRFEEWVRTTEGRPTPVSAEVPSFFDLGW